MGELDLTISELRRNCHSCTQWNRVASHLYGRSEKDNEGQHYSRFRACMLNISISKNHKSRCLNERRDQVSFCQNDMLLFFGWTLH